MATASMSAVTCMAAVQPLTVGSVQVRNVSAKAPLTVRCGPIRASSEKSASQPSKNGTLLSAAIGAAAAIAIGITADSSIAAVGEGGDGAARTAEKADELLKAADKLTSEDSPARFGLTSTGTSEDKTATLAQQGGSGAIEAIQGTQSQVEGVASKAKDAVGALPSIESAKSDIGDAAQAAADSAPSFFSNLKNSFGLSSESAPSLDDVKAKVGDVAKDVKAKLPGQ